MKLPKNKKNKDYVKRMDNFIEIMERAFLVKFPDKDLKEWEKFKKDLKELT